jgi:hypothetical protein
MPTIAFLFQGDDLRVGDFDLICEAIFQAVLSTTSEDNFHLRSGGILLQRFSERMTAVSRARISNRPTISYTVSDDKALRATIAAAFAVSASAQHHRFETEALSTVFVTKEVECVTVSDMRLGCADLIHHALKEKLACYLGCFEVDRGDPLALELAANGLIPFCHYENRALKWIVPFDHDGADDTVLSWARQLPFSSIKLTSHDPDRILGEQVSPQGEKSVQLLNGRAHSQHAEDVLIAFRTSLQDSKDTTELRIEFGKAEFGNIRADVRKLRDYCLNEQHTKPDGTPGDGRGKAYLFRRLLGITRNDWRFLGEQLVAGLTQALVKRVRKSDYGIQYTLTIPVTGRNGVTKLVTSGWIIRPNESPSLATAYIADNAETTEAGPLAHLVVDRPDDSDFWQRLYERARQHGAKMAEDWTPTPMWVEGVTEAIVEGICGSAWVRVPDARSRFSRWLKKNDLGSSGHGRGCFVFAGTASQSLERAQKYCEGFAQVLRLNGVECEVGWRED